MTEGDIVTQLIIRYGFEAVILGLVSGAVVFLLLKIYLPGYLSEKGKNLATSEDIEKITQKIESVKLDYSKLLEELKSKHQLKLAAIDKRLDVHQEAFTLWRRLMSKAHTEEVFGVVMECQTWWEENCLYLEPSARTAFSDAYHSAMSHKDILNTRNPDRVQENFSKIREAGQKILEAVQLPRLSDVELKELKDQDGKPKS